MHVSLFNYIANYIQLNDVVKTSHSEAFAHDFIKKNTLFEKAGHVPELLHFIVSGFVLRYYLDDFSNEIVTDINRGVGFLTTYNHFLNNTISPKKYIETVKDVEILQINRLNVFALLAQHSIMQEFQSNLSLKMSNDNRQRAIDLAALPAKELYSKFMNENPSIMQNVPPCTYCFLFVHDTTKPKSPKKKHKITFFTIW